jgi:signal peptide peptidase SppA
VSVRALTAATNVPWAITEDALQGMLDIAAQHRTLPPDERERHLKAVAATLGRPLDNTHTVTVRDGVATIPVDGPLFRHADMFTQVSGATSIDTLATDLRAALDDPTIRAVVLAINSPGGEVDGTAEFADQVYAARGVKPIAAYISNDGCSGAYWIASACREVVVAPTAIVGSIGVITAMRHPADGGARKIEFASRHAPDKRLDPSTTAGRAQIQAMIDATEDVFVTAVARNRGVEKETVLSDFGQGGVFIGQAAVDAGLADRIGSYEDVVAALVKKTAGRIAPAASAGHMAGGWKTALQGAMASGGSMDWKNVFSGMFAAAKEHEAAQGEGDGAPATPAGVTIVDAASANRGADTRDELAQARARAEDAERTLAAHRADAITADAARFAEGLVKEHRIMPAARPEWEATYKAARESDDAGRTTGFAERITALAGTGEKHKLTEELLDPKQTVEILSGSAEDKTDPLAEVDASARSYAEKQNKKGRASGAGAKGDR